MNTTLTRHDLTDEQWAKLLPHLPPQNPAVGRPALDHRRVLNAILWLIRTSAPWRDLPPHYGNWSSVASRFYRWSKKGLWNTIMSELLQQSDQQGQLDWQAHYVDGTVIRAHQHAAGAAGTTAEEQALGRSQGGFSTKVHLKAEGQGQPLNVVLTPGQQHETTVFEQLAAASQVKRAGRGRPRWRPRYLVGDKGYSSHKIREWLRTHRIGAVIPRRRTEKVQGRLNQPLYRQRNRVERLFNRLKQFRRIATRYEKKALYYRAVWVIGCIFLWLDFANTPQVHPTAYLCSVVLRVSRPIKNRKFLTITYKDGKGA